MAVTPGFRRDLIVRAIAVSGAVVSLAALAVAAARQPNARLVRARHEVRSPSGNFVARVEIEQLAGGEKVWRPVVADRLGSVVYRAGEVIVSKPAPRIMWENDLDTLWVIAPASVAFVQEGLHGWTSTELDAADQHLVPSEARG